MKTPEEIASACVTQYCTPDEYDGKVKAAITAAIQAERDAQTKRIAELERQLKAEQQGWPIEQPMVDSPLPRQIVLLNRRIAELEKQALLADRSNADRLAAYEKLFRENAGLRKQIEDLTTGQRIKVCSSDDRTETLREESQYPLRSTDKVVPVVNCEQRIAELEKALEPFAACVDDFNLVHVRHAAEVLKGGKV
jgi:hypothetical protein